MRYALVAMLAFSAALLHADEDPYANRIAKAPTDGGAQLLKRMSVPEGLEAKVWATEPMLANPVAFTFDEKGRCFVAETFRLNKGATDNRSHMNKPGWLDEELACRTVADRIALYKKYLGKNFNTYAVEHDRVRLVEETNGDGKADKATVFADGFKNAEDGIGSGLLARGNKVWFTCIPDLWLLEDTKNQGKADIKVSLSTGYGVHVAFIGHDLHGLIMGPDGKIYFSIGDRGLHVVKDGKTFAYPDSGSVLRCDPDGKNLEIFATGLRNPQELAFDDFGNLFTGDNNADGGDKARWVHLVEGGDSGWRIGYQYLKGLGPWNAEKLWHTMPANTGHYLLPPLDHIGNGPSGLAYYPGVTRLPEKYKNHFFLCDFRGSGGGSGVHAFQLKPKGASFETTGKHQFTWSVLATDCDFTPDGSFALLDWTDGWSMPNRGRIYMVGQKDRTAENDPKLAEVKNLLAEGLGGIKGTGVFKLLGHPDRRIRMEAQFHLVNAKAAYALLDWAGKKQEPLLARIHALWALGQLGRTMPGQIPYVKSFVKDPEPEIRAQAIKVLGESGQERLGETIAPALADPEARVRMFAGLALARVGTAEQIPAVLAMLKENADRDPYLRHAGVMALAGIGKREALVEATKNADASIRMGALLALRRTKSADAAKFLQDADPKIVLEAARAINDAPIVEAFDDLAKWLDRPTSTMKGWPTDIVNPVLARAVNANFRLGKSENAERLVRFASRSDAPESARIEALKSLGFWAEPSGRDRVVGLWRPLDKRNADEVTAVLKPALAGLLTGADAVRTEAVQLAGKFGIKEVGPVLRDLLGDSKQKAEVRVETLRALEKIKDAQLDAMAQVALNSDQQKLRHEGRRLVLKHTAPHDAVEKLNAVLDGGELFEKQGAFALLGEVKSPSADQLLLKWLDQLQSHKAPAELELDILESAKKNNTKDVVAALTKIEKGRDAKDHLASFRAALKGGDAESGRRLFHENTTLSCLRCHKVQGLGGEVGPDLTGIGKKEKREYLLESIVQPDKQIAKGFDTLVLVLTNGQTKSGILKSEDAKEVRLMTAEGQIISIPVAQIEERARGKSAMPEDFLKQLKMTELRDLVEYLSSLQ